MGGEKKREGAIQRRTKETDIDLKVLVDGSGETDIKSGVPFLDHMLTLFGVHGFFDLTVAAVGDTDIDDHHTVEDIGLCMGSALDQALGSRAGITRYGSAIIPMDEALSRAVIDLGGRPCLVYEIACRRKKILDFDLNLIREFFQAFCVQARMNLHITQFYGKEPHHAYESVFKAFSRALRAAVKIDPREKGVPSSKGQL